MIGYHEDLSISSHIISQNIGDLRRRPEPSPDTSTTATTSTTASTASTRRPTLPRWSHKNPAFKRGLFCQPRRRILRMSGKLSPFYSIEVIQKSSMKVLFLKLSKDLTKIFWCQEVLFYIEVVHKWRHKYFETDNFFNHIR